MRLYLTSRLLFRARQDCIIFQSVRRRRSLKAHNIRRWTLKKRVKILLNGCFQSQSYNIFSCLVPPEAAARMAALLLKYFDCWTYLIIFKAPKFKPPAAVEIRPAFVVPHVKTTRKRKIYDLA